MGVLLAALAVSAHASAPSLPSPTVGTISITQSGSTGDASSLSVTSNGATINLGTLAGEVSSALTGLIARSISPVVSATGVSLATATPLVSGYNVVTSCAGGVNLPSNRAIGTDVFVYNRCTVPLQVYPDTAATQIESLTQGTPVGLDIGVSYHFVKTSPTQWLLDTPTPQGYAPVLTIAGTAATLSYGKQVGRAKQEVGICTFAIQIEYSALTSRTGPVVITGTPCFPLAASPVVLQTINEYGVTTVPLNAVMNTDGSISIENQGVGSSANDPALPGTALSATGGFYISGRVFTQ